MNASFYEGLKKAFIEIRFVHLKGNFDQNRLNSAIERIKFAKKQIKKNSRPQEKIVLLYCIERLFDILNEGNSQKILDYTDTIYNIPDIYRGYRNLYSFRSKFEKFRKKYGEDYFPFLKKIYPEFSTKAPKNKWEFFSPQSDEDFKRLHPVEYKVLCIVGVIALFAPMSIYLAYSAFIDPAPGGWPIVIGFVGSFVMGIGFFNIVAAWIHQYLGHLLTAVCIVGGGLMTALALYW